MEGDGNRERSRNHVSAVGRHLDLDRLVAVEHLPLGAPARAADPDGGLRVIGGLAPLGVGAIGAEHLDGGLDLACLDGSARGGTRLSRGSRFGLGRP